jgi:hypothetical protein
MGQGITSGHGVVTGKFIGIRLRHRVKVTEEVGIYDGELHRVSVFLNV